MATNNHREQKKALIDKYRKLTTSEEENWQREIELLEKHVHTEVIDVPLTEGSITEGSIAIWSWDSMTEADRKRIREIINTYSNFDLTKEEDKEKSDDLTYEQLALITANPELDKQWWKDNVDRYTQGDIAKILSAFYQQLALQTARLGAIRSFRGK